VGLGGDVLLPIGVRYGERTMPLRRKLFEFYACIDYILEHSNSLLN